MDFQEEFLQFMSENGLGDRHDFVPVPLASYTEEDARQARIALQPLAGHAMFIAEDRWRADGALVRARVLSHAGLFRQVYARNCAVRRISRETAAHFLEQSHTYGYALCRFRYGLFVEKVTGEKGSLGVKDYPCPLQGDLVAVATFSKARGRMVDGERVRSFEWVRYASLPGVRVIGGMGKVLSEFISEVGPEDVMTYADLEWSDGGVYRDLGFRLEGPRDPVMFAVDPRTWRRTALKYVTDPSGMLFFENFGSLKYRLKLK